MELFIVNMKHAIRNRETVTIGGGEFSADELKAVVDKFETTPAKIFELQKQRDALLELLEQAVSMAELRLDPNLADKGVSGITDYWLEPAKLVIDDVNTAPRKTSTRRSPGM